MFNRTAFVTGGTRGIGKAISEDLAKDCKQVIAGYLSNDEAADTWIEKLQQRGINNVSLFKADVANPATTELIQKELLTKFGAIDILVNNAGITRNMLFETMSFSDWKQVLATNLDSLYIITKPIIDSMIKNGFGRIINISSVNGQKGQYNEVNYSTTKAGIRGFTKALAQELAQKGITVNTVSPGYINTELTETLPKELLETIISKVPVKRLGTPYEVARMVTFLANDDSGFITGADFSVNGGLHML